MGLNIARFMSEELIQLNMETVVPEYVEGSSLEKWRHRGKELVPAEIVKLLEKSGRTGNSNKLLTDFINRERKATTAIGYGIAIPHIRSMQAKTFLLTFARSPRGYDFGALDEQPTQLFFAMAAPPYDDLQYLRVFKALAEMLRYETFRDELMQATTPYEIIRAIESMG